MKHPLLTACAAVALLFSPAVAWQDGGEAPDEPRPEQPRIGEGMLPDPQTSELIELFKAVDEKLRAIDNMLFDMGAGERPLEAPEDSGLGALLEATRQASESVVQDIDRILQIADELSQQQQQQQQQSSSSSSNSGSTPPPQSSQSEQQENPSGEQDQNQQSPQPEQPQGQTPEQGQEPQQEQGQQNEPSGGQETDDPAQNRAGEAGQQHATGAGSQADRTERWGELPERVRETFRNQGGDNAPLHYRDWIDSYYRHLNRADT